MKRFWQAISPHSSFNLFKSVCERSWEIAPADCKKEGKNCKKKLYRAALTEVSSCVTSLGGFWRGLYTVLIFGILAYTYDIVVQAFFCPVVLNSERDTKQDPSKNWSEDYAKMQLPDTDLALAQIIAPLGGDVNRLPCLLLPSGRRQKRERMLYPPRQTV